MASYGAPISDLCRCFRGLPPKQADWMSIIALANVTLTTPALVTLLKSPSADVPPEVRRYITEIAARNALRNDRLSAQLWEAVAALNGRDITPVLMKGAALLAGPDGACADMRLISDLDILVEPHEAHAALDCLQKLDYRVHFQSPPGAAKWYADLMRPEDAGMVDLHQALPGHGFFYRSFGDVKRSAKLISSEHGSVYIPSPTYQALILIVHDQFQDSDYWVGAMDLRHLLDLRALAASPGGLDWQMLGSLNSSKLVRNALETHLVSLSSLLDVDVPVALRQRLIPRLQHWRRLVQMRAPPLKYPLLAMALLDYWNYRVEVGREERRAKKLESRTWALPRADTMRFLLGLSRHRRGGKI